MSIHVCIYFCVGRDLPVHEGSKSVYLHGVSGTRAPESGRVAGIHVAICVRLPHGESCNERDRDR